MSGGNITRNYPLGLWSQICFSITMISTLHRNQGTQNPTYVEHIKHREDQHSLPMHNRKLEHFK